MFRRRQAKTQGRLMREELAESFEHLRIAVGHAAGGTANLVGPGVTSARRSAMPKLRSANRATAATVVPIARAARKGAVKGKAKLTRKEPRVKRWPMVMGGLLAAGAAVGAASALVARRRADRGQWEEYGTSGSGQTGSSDSTIGAAVSSAGSTIESGRDKVQSLADSAKERAADMMGRSGSDAPAPEFGSREDLYGKAASSSRNSR